MTLVRIRFVGTHRGASEFAKGPVDLRPDERAHHGRYALVREAQQDCEANTVSNAIASAPGPLDRSLSPAA